MKIKLLTSFLFLIFVSTSLLAARPSINELNTRVNQLEAENNAQQSEIDALTSDVGTLQIEVDALELVATSGIKSVSGVFTSQNSNSHLVSTGIPSGSTLVEIFVVQPANQIYAHWFAGMFNHLNGAGNIGIALNAANRFDISGVNFTVGNTGPNAGVGNTVRWTVYYK